MKRLFILSAAVAALASCSNSEVITEVNEPQVPDKAIAFETFSSNATRAEGDPKSENSGQTADNTDGLENHHGNFSVWGYKDVQTDYVFGTASDSEGKSSTGVTVTAVDNPASSGTYIWKYSPIRFWDKGANSYEFYACAPATETTTDPHFVLNKKTGGTQADDYFTLNAVTLSNYTLRGTQYAQSMKENQVQNSEDGSTQTTTGGNIDYMIADACKITTFTSPVLLHFNHILSRLNITVKKGTTLNNTANVRLDVVSLEVKYMAAKGSFDESKADNTSSVLANGTTTRWTLESEKVNYVANALANVTDNEQYILQSLVLPQEVEYEEITLDGKVGDSRTAISTATQPYMKIVYTIKTTDSLGTTTNSETYTAYYNLAAVFGANSTTTTTKVAFNEGWQNTLHITIDATQITFDPDVYQWMDKENKDFNAESGASSNHRTNP